MIYKSVEDFYRVNPFCCDWVFGDGWRGRHRIIKTHLRRYSYNPSIYYRYLKDGEAPIRHSYAYISHCGGDYQIGHMGFVSSMPSYKRVNKINRSPEK